MFTCPMREGVPILILRHGNDAHHFLIQQAQPFEGNLYPDALDFCADYSDAIVDAIGWREIGKIHAPQTIDVLAVEVMP